ncbi:phage head completion protein [Aeromonas veronii]|uniref:phage head completion protein n=1 Tax=Aeromonas veronii TaxID=654 RepID=UPI0032F07744
MNTGNMRNSVKVYHLVQTQNEVGEFQNTKELFVEMKAEVQFEKVQDSGSKFDKAWANRLVIKTRYSKSLTPLIDSCSGFVMEFQNKTYKIVSYESWNMVQKFITFYVEKD